MSHPGADEAAPLLDDIARLCGSVPAPTEPLRQHVVGSLDPGEAASLLSLQRRSAAAMPALRAVAERTSTLATGGKAAVKLCPPKGLQRCLEKTHEEYRGDYLRLVDVCRATLVCDDLGSLRAALHWLLSDEEDAFTPLRVKDRLTRAWDAQISGFAPASVRARARDAREASSAPRRTGAVGVDGFWVDRDLATQAAIATSS